MGLSAVRDSVAAYQAEIREAVARQKAREGDREGDRLAKNKVPRHSPTRAAPALPGAEACLLPLQATARQMMFVNLNADDAQARLLALRPGAAKKMRRWLKALGIPIKGHTEPSWLRRLAHIYGSIDGDNSGHIGWEELDQALVRNGVYLDEPEVDIPVAPAGCHTAILLLVVALLSLPRCNATAPSPLSVSVPTPGAPPRKLTCLC